MNITIKFGKQIRHYREIKKISQEELAHLCGLHRTYIGSVERGERNITLVNAEKLSIALGIELCLLFKNKEEK